MMNEFCLGNKFLRHSDSSQNEMSLQKQIDIDKKIKLEKEINYTLGQLSI